MAAQQNPAFQAFFTELAKLNALARMIEEAPVPVERIDHLYKVFQDAAMDAGRKIQEAMMEWDFEKALKSLTDEKAFEDAHVRYFAKLEGMSEVEYAFFFYGEREEEYYAE